MKYYWYFDKERRGYTKKTQFLSLKIESLKIKERVVSLLNIELDTTLLNFIVTICNLPEWIF